MTDDHEATEELLAGYVLRSLSGADAAEADRLLSEHVPGCTTCRDTLDDLQRLTADLGLAASPIEAAVVFLIRFDPADDLHVRNRDWLRTRQRLEVVVDLEALSISVRGEPPS